MKEHALLRIRLLVALVRHVMIPLWIIALMSTAGTRDSATWLFLLFATAAFVSYISLAGAWSWFGVYTQRALPLLLLATAFITRPQFVSVNESPQSSELRLLSLAVAILFLTLTAFALVGRWSRRPALDLTFPLKDGTFIVGQGGRTKTINHHARSRTQGYSIDIMKLSRSGFRAQGIYPVDPKKYMIYGVDVVCPAAGVVSAVVEDLPDQIPPASDPTNPQGNYVAIEMDGVTVYLAHLMKGSVTVDPGQRVRLGQVLGRVGNSGDSSEPHLHIHAEKHGAGIPLRFNGRFLVKNDLVRL